MVFLSILGQRSSLALEDHSPCSQYGILVSGFGGSRGDFICEELCLSVLTWVLPEELMQGASLCFTEFRTYSGWNAQ